MINTLEIILLIGVILIVYMHLIKYIFTNFENSKGFLSKLFWFILMFATLSFLFGSSRSSASMTNRGSCGGYTDDDNHNCIENDDYLHNDFLDLDSDDYDYDYSDYVDDDDYDD